MFIQNPGDLGQGGVEHAAGVGLLFGDINLSGDAELLQLYLRAV